METILLIISFCLGWVPLGVLLVNSMHNIEAKYLWRFFGVPSLALLLIIWLYSAQVYPSLASLIGWGVISGIALTIALDIVRLTGVKLGTMPMDMPVSFGLRATGLFTEVKKRMMAKIQEMKMMQMPQGLSMFGAATMMKPIINDVLTETKSKSRVMLIGYIWHFLNGISIGLGYTLLFGSGHWLIALGWGVLIWALMMLVMPAMMNGARLTRSIFITAFIAHIAMALPLIWISSAVIFAGSNTTYNFGNFSKARWYLLKVDPTN